MTALFNPDVKNTLSPQQLGYRIQNLAQELILLQKNALIVTTQPHLNVAASGTLTTDIVSTQIRWRNNAKSVLDTVTPSTIKVITNVNTLIGLLSGLEAVLNYANTNSQLTDVLNIVANRIQEYHAALTDLSDFARREAQAQEQAKIAFSQELDDAIKVLDGPDGKIKKWQTDIDNENAKILRSIREIVLIANHLGNQVANIVTSTITTIQDFIPSKPDSGTPSKPQPVSISGFNILSSGASDDYLQPTTSINEGNAKLANLYQQLASLNGLVAAMKVVQVQIFNYSTSLSTFEFHVTNAKENMDLILLDVKNFQNELNTASESSISNKTRATISTAVNQWKAISLIILRSLTALANLGK